MGGDLPIDYDSRFFFATDAKLRKKIMDVNKKFNPSRALRVCMDAYI